MIQNRRQYIRHPSDIPIWYTLTGGIMLKSRSVLHDVSLGGLSFQTERLIEKGTILTVQINLVTPAFRAMAAVVWCQSKGMLYDVGVRFLDKGTEFRARMVEQICHIEQYKHRILATEGRRLSGEEAAFEWICRYADQFPA